MSSVPPGSPKQYDFHPRAGIRNREPPSAGPRRDASCRRNGQQFADDFLPLQRLFSECAVRFQDEGDRLVQIYARLFQGRALGVRPGQLLNETDISF